MHLLLTLLFMVRGAYKTMADPVRRPGIQALKVLFRPDAFNACGSYYRTLKIIPLLCGQIQYVHTTFYNTQGSAAGK